MPKKTTLTVTSEPHSTVPSEAEVRKHFQTSHYVRPASDGEGGNVGRLDLDGPIYPSWSTVRDANRQPGVLRCATESELKRFNEITLAEGEHVAHDWLTEEWT